MILKDYSSTYIDKKELVFLAIQYMENLATIYGCSACGFVNKPCSQTEIDNTKKNFSIFFERARFSPIESLEVVIDNRNWVKFIKFRNKSFIMINWTRYKTEDDEKYIIDENLNVLEWCKYDLKTFITNEFTPYNAYQLLKNVEGCKLCVNCIDCTNCDSCVKCNKCANCIECTECEKSFSCSNCTFVKKCINCTNVKHSEKCENLTNVSGGYEISNQNLLKTINSNECVINNFMGKISCYIPENDYWQNQKLLWKSASEIKAELQRYHEEYSYRRGKWLRTYKNISSLLEQAEVL